MTEQAAVAILTFISAVAILVSQNPIGQPIAPLLLLISGVVDLGIAIFFGGRAAINSKFGQTVITKLKK